MATLELCRDQPGPEISLSQAFGSRFPPELRGITGLASFLLFALTRIRQEKEAAEVSQMLRVPLCMAADHAGTPTPCPPYLPLSLSQPACHLQSNPMADMQAQACHVATLETEAGRHQVPGQPGL